MISGSTGYVAGWIVKKFLEKGYTLHLPVRDPKNELKTQHIKDLAKSLPGEVVFFEADLLKKDSYFDSMQGCVAIIHTASPFITNVKNSKKDLIEPALIGTENILNSVNKTKSIKKVILTSSVTAVVGDALEFRDGKKNEEHWNITSNKHHQPYSYSKTLAEKKAWEIYNQQKNWELITLNPSLVIGPSLNKQVTSESYKIIKQLGSGQLKYGVPEYFIAAVDVRDVAEAHLKAFESSQAQGRYILSAKDTSLFEISCFIAERFGDNYPLPKTLLPKLLVWSLAPFLNLKRKVVAKNIGYPWNLDNTKSIKELGMDYTDIKISAQEFFAQIYNEEI